jgi:deoxyribonuclease-4
MSVAGGLWKAFDDLEKAGGGALQIFTKNQRRWSSPALADETCDKFIERWQQCGKPPVASHGSYLLNLATANPELVLKSIANLSDELQRCQALRIPYVVIHPGAHGGDGVEEGLSRLSKNLDRAIEESGATDVTVLLETISGQGTGLGATFAQLAEAISLSSLPQRLGVCVDTCHIFAAGYEINTAKGYEATFKELEASVGLENLKWFHLNDSLGALGSNKDRHTHIGEGEIGLDGFRLLMNDPRFTAHPMTLETPKGDDLEHDIKNLRTLTSLSQAG